MACRARRSRRALLGAHLRGGFGLDEQRALIDAQQKLIAEQDAAIEAGPGNVGNEAAAHELPGHRPHPPVDFQLGHEQQGQREQ